MNPKTKDKKTDQRLCLEESENPIDNVEEPAAEYGKRLFSYADYLTWPEEEMKEIINGIVYTFSAPLLKHAAATGAFFGKAWNYINRRKGKCKIYTAPFDVRLPKNGETADDKIYNVVQPDICVVCDKSKLDEKGCIGAPDLVVEVNSPSTSRLDLNQKFFLYEASGVREYWIVLPNDKAVTVFLLQPSGKFDEGTTYEVVKGQTKVPVQTLEGLVIDLEELFEDVIMKDEKTDNLPYSTESENPIDNVEEPAAEYGKRLFSYADYLTWPEEEMKEIINGIVYAFSAPLLKHATATINFLKKSLIFVDRRKGKCKIYTAPFDVRLPKNGETADDKIYNVVQPDICVVCDKSKLDEKGCIGAPDLVVEVNSPSTSKLDLNQKFFLYEASGVREYWIVLPNDKAVTVFLLQPSGKFDEGTTYEVVKGQTKVPVQTLEGLVIDLEELFED